MPNRNIGLDTNKLFSKRDVTLSDQHIHVNGNLAWEMGQESGTQKMKNSNEAPIDYIVTNVYEKIDGRWLIVSHHVQPEAAITENQAETSSSCLRLMHRTGGKACGLSSSGRRGSRGVLSRRHATGEEVPISRMKEREFISAYDQEEDYSPD